MRRADFAPYLPAARAEHLLARLADEGVTLEVCPSSNVATGVVPTLAEHPLPRLLEAGVPVVLCSDDPPMFGTSLPEEHRRAPAVLGLSEGQLRELARRSIEASFAPEVLKRRPPDARAPRYGWSPMASSASRTCAARFRRTRSSAWNGFRGGA